MSGYCSVALPRGAVVLSAVCDCGIFIILLAYYFCLRILPHSTCIFKKTKNWTRSKNDKFICFSFILFVLECNLSPHYYYSDTLNIT